MRVGLVVEGESEYYGLRHVISHIASDDEVLPVPVLCRVHPLAPLGRIALAVSQKAGVLVGKGAQRIVVVLDHEQRDQCPGVFAQALANAVAERLSTLGIAAEAEVVLKVQCLENWLIADAEAIRGNPGLFRPPRNIAVQVRGNADNLPAIVHLKRWVRPSVTYEKVEFATAICRQIEPRRAAENSRSFRRFLRVLGDPLYRDQSRQPKR